MTSPSHSGGRGFESLLAHSVSPIKICTGFDLDNASLMSRSITLKALLPVFFRKLMVFLGRVRWGNLFPKNMAGRNDLKGDVIILLISRDLMDGTCNLSLLLTR
jgi:hypothetical protein